MKPKRIQRKRVKGWRMPPNTVYVGRPSKWGNPFKLGSISNFGGLPLISMTAVLGHYSNYVIRKFSEKVIAEELKGKNLACWCPMDQPCHADILLKLANEN